MNIERQVALEGDAREAERERQWEFLKDAEDDFLNSFDHEHDDN